MERQSDGSDAPAPSAADIGRWRAARQAAGSMMLALDFDGTLAPIVPHPADAAMAEGTRRVLRALAERDDTTVALVSGRALADVQGRAAVPGAIYAGNHGLELHGPGIDRTHPEARAARGLLDEALGRLRAELAVVEGAEIEDKGLTLTVHYRRVDPGEHERVRRTVAAVRTDGLRITEGKRVLEVRPDVDWHKGRAILWLLDQLALPDAAPVLYIGDDTTDEDAFAALGARGEGIVVAETSRPTAARFRVPSPRAVTELLQHLAERSAAGAA